MWSIGIYTGSSPFCMTPATEARNPVLPRNDIRDVPAKFVADPFMISVGELWYMFFEVLNEATDKGEIGLATSHNGFDWTYQQIVLTEEFHLSYPYVFEWKDEYYMIPEALKAGAAGLYKAESFPTGWRYHGPLVKGNCADPSILYFDHRWWMFICTLPYQHNELRLYSAEELTGEWIEHPKSPIISGNKRTARPAGRVVIFNDKIVRFSQDCIPEYGTQVRAFEISRLTTEDYAETEHPESPILTATGRGWNGFGMHHIDLHLLSDGRWIACVDGFGEYRNLAERSQTA